VFDDFNCSAGEWSFNVLGVLHIVLHVVFGICSFVRVE
jgi:hypothetical protein